MNKLSSLTIFFPAYNEEENIRKTIEGANRIAKDVTDDHNDYEILIIDDGSRDKTAQVVQEAIKEYPNVRLIKHSSNKGYGAALMTGFSNASKEWVFFSDSDLQFDLSEINKLTQYSNSYDIIIGYRIKRNDPFMRWLNAKGWNILNRMLFGLKVQDIDCAFKLMRRDAVQKVLPHMKSRGAMISAELLIRLKNAGYKFKEVGVNHYPRTRGSQTGAKPSVIIRAFKEMALVYKGDLGPAWSKQVIKFLIVGIGNTLVDWTSYFLLSRFIPFFMTRKVWAKGISYILGVTNSFIWNRSWTFRSSIDFFPGFIIFALVSIASLGINTSVMYVSYTFFKFPEFIALLTATIFTLSWNFLASKFIIFRDR